MDTKQKAAGFLMRSTFGGTTSEIDALTGTNVEDWLAAQFAKPATLYYPPLRADPDARAGTSGDRAHAELFWDTTISTDDQLRQRMVFALSQIFVVSDLNIHDPLVMGHYMDVLSSNAFGNYRDLMQDITYAPATARFLTYLRNLPADSSTGRQPDENYARELVQLFTLGLVQLNMDGTPVVDGDGKPVEIYSNEDIVGLARVFTGLSYKGSSFWVQDGDAWWNDLVMYDGQHERGEKTFLGLTIPAGTGGDESISRALDHIFEHPNLAPFVSKLLIQRFTDSSPDPKYVERVATAFETGEFEGQTRTFGTGERGCLQATLAAILLDPMFYNGAFETDPTGAKLREPVLRFTHWARAFDVYNLDASNEFLLHDTSSSGDGLGQQPFHAPSVFNFYRPGYVAPGTKTGERELTAPELQITDDSSVIGYTNFMTTFITDGSLQRNHTLGSYRPDYTDELALADDPEALVDHLNDLLMAGRMGAVVRERMIETVSLLPIRTDTLENQNADKQVRVEIAISMAITSPGFIVQR